MHMVGLALCRGPQVWHEIALQLARQTTCTDLQLNIMVMPPPLQSKEVRFHFTQVSYLLEETTFPWFIDTSSEDTDIHTYKTSTEYCYILRRTEEMCKTELQIGPLSIHQG